MRDIYNEIRLRVAYYMSKSENRWTQPTWRMETLKVENGAVTEAGTTIGEVAMRLKFDDNVIQLDGEWIEQKWKPAWRKVKTALQKDTKQMRIETYQSKNLHRHKASSILSMLEQMMETRPWKVARGMIEDGRCRVCHGQDKTVEQLVAGCTVLSSSEYLTRHCRALTIHAVTWVKERKLIGADTVWYKERWEQRIVLEND